MNKKEIRSNIIWFGSLIVILLLIRQFIFMSVVVSGNSMDPTMQDRERVIALRNKKIKRFDIVTFPAPDAPKKSYIKRVIGLPGDEIEYQDDELYINGKKVKEPYLDEYKEDLEEGDNLTKYMDQVSGEVFNDFSINDILGVEKVPEGELFVLGDNRQISKDSRYVGFIKEEDITGNVKFSFWPPSKFGKVE